MKLFTVTIAFFHLLALGQSLQDLDEDFVGSLEQAEHGARSENVAKEGKDSGAMVDTVRDLGYLGFVLHRKLSPSYSSYSSVGKGKGKGKGSFDETMCSAHDKCADLHGACCPNTEGVFLDCCSNKPDNFEEDRKCSSHDKCADLGLTGLCCATKDGVYLDCCDKKQEHFEEDRKCSSHDKCADLGLTGLCCATEDGVYLDCCDKKPGYGKGKGKGVAPDPHPTPKPSYKPTPYPTQKPTNKPSPKPTPKPSHKPSPKPTYKPAYKPTYKPTPKPTPMPPIYSTKGKGKGKGQEKAPVSCRNTVLHISQYWDGPIIEPDGTKVDGPGSASVKAGQTWPFANHVHAVEEGNHKDDDNDDEEEEHMVVVGSNAELCIRLNDGDVWHCAGTYLDLDSCHGQLSFAGPFSDNAFVGKYTLTSGTGDFEGATGYIIDEFSYDTHYSIRTIYIN